jgi:hypothetical protein
MIIAHAKRKEITEVEAKAPAGVNDRAVTYTA